jgi:hypothetical protein
VNKRSIEEGNRLLLELFDEMRRGAGPPERGPAQGEPKPDLTHARLPHHSEYTSAPPGCMPFTWEEVFDSFRKLEEATKHSKRVKHCSHKCEDTVVANFFLNPEEEAYLFKSGLRCRCGHLDTLHVQDCCRYCLVDEGCVC